MRKGVGVVPVDLSGHKIVQAAFFHNLGQGGTIAEHIGQPQYLAVPAKLLTDKLLAVKDVADQGFAGGNGAVRLQPHAALHLPPPFGDSRFNPGVQLRRVILDESIQLGLAGHKLVLGVLLHEMKNSREAADHLLTGLLHCPQPGDVNVGVADAVLDSLYP
ncbi:hypothetical protein D3C75_743710 [compost metagenome]